jgi:hypothetical protein
MDLLLPDRKSDIAQKKVTVCREQLAEVLGNHIRITGAYRQSNIEIIILRAKLVKGINEVKKTRSGQRREEVGANELQRSKRRLDESLRSGNEG